jgi:K+-sensing histidine kinase KdpD
VGQPSDRRRGAFVGSTRDYAWPVHRIPLAARRPTRIAGIAAAGALLTVETLVLYPLSEVASAVSLGVVYLPGVLVISIVWGAGLGVMTSVAGALALN